MASSDRRKHDFDKVADIIRDAGGRIIGRTRLQKIGYLLEISGLGEGFGFEYRHYGPYSEQLASAARVAKLLGVIEEEERQAAWGGFYSIFTSTVSQLSRQDQSRLDLIRVAAEADPIELELAATAAFLSDGGATDPWKETEKRKPAKAQGGRLESARALYRRLQQIETPRPLPRIG
jgi:uncharacterized protein YwgA